MRDAETRRFWLQRDADITGISGTGIVATGVEFADGQVAVKWLGQWSSLVIWPDIEALIHVNGHGGKTRIVWLDPA